MLEGVHGGQLDGLDVGDIRKRCHQQGVDYLLVHELIDQKSLHQGETCRSKDAYEWYQTDDGNYASNKVYVDIHEDQLECTLKSKYQLIDTQNSQMIRQDQVSSSTDDSIS